MKIVKDAAIVDKYGTTYLFGTVVQDDRFETGHRILTSEIVNVDMGESTITTKSGTVYEFENIMTKEELVNHLRNTEKDEIKLRFFLDLIL